MGLATENASHPRQVAALGLTPKHVGQPIAQLRDTLHALNAKYDLHICGEGGEYETMALDGPLFHASIVIETSELVLHSDDAIAPVAYLRATHARLQPKDRSPPAAADERSAYCRQLLAACNAEYRRSSSVLAWPALPAPSVPRAEPSVAAASPLSAPDIACTVAVWQPWCAVSCHLATPAVCRGPAAILTCVCVQHSLAAEAEAVMAASVAGLAQHGAAASAVVLIHVFLRDMADFAALNR